MWYKLLKLIYPDRCVFCDDIYRGNDHIHICANCLKKVRFLDEMRTCKKCSRPVGENEILCLNCKINPHPYLIHVSCMPYIGAVRESILRFKFINRPQYHITYANMILNQICSFGAFPRPDLVLFVPADKERRKRRGYNQSALIAKKVAKLLDCPYGKTVLAKVKVTVPQSKVMRKDRRANIAGAFVVKDKESVAGKTVLVIDDVYTTGSTIDEIAKVLIKTGVKQVVAATVAITPT